MYLEQALWNLASGALGGGIVAFIQSQPYFIKRKTRAEGTQKRALEDIPKIIDEIEEVKRAVNLLHEEMLFLEYQFEGGEGTGNDVFSVKEITKRRLENFIFSVKKSIIIGGKDQTLEKEKENLENICEEMFSHFEFVKPDPHETSFGDRESIDWGERYQDMALNFNRMKVPEKINTCIEKIEKRYQKKLT